MHDQQDNYSPDYPGRGGRPILSRLFTTQAVVIGVGLLLGGLVAAMGANIGIAAFGGLFFLLL